MCTRAKGGQRGTVTLSVLDFPLHSFSTSFYKQLVNQYRLIVFFSSNKMYKVLYLFSTDAVTNYYKHGGLKQHTFISLQFWLSKV